MTLLYDEHMHLRPHTTPPTPHDLGPLLDACADRGVHPGIREHALLPERYRLGPYGDYVFCMLAGEVDRFFELLLEKQVPFGLEMDHIDGQESETLDLLEGFKARARKLGMKLGGFTGSVHLIPGRVADLGPDVDKRGVPHILYDYLESVMVAHVREHGAERTVREYFGSLRRMIGRRIYDTVGHLELIRKFDRRDEHGVSTLFGQVEDAYDEEVDATLRAAADAGMLVEYNTGGVDAPLGRPYLSDRAVKVCLDLGVRISISSDAHRPAQVARHFDASLARLKSLGVRELWGVRDRQQLAVAI